MSAAAAVIAEPLSIGARMRLREERQRQRARAKVERQLSLALTTAPSLAVLPGATVTDALALRVRAALYEAPGALTVEELAQWVGCSAKAVRGALRVLRTRGLLEVEGSRRERRYLLVLRYRRPRVSLPMAMVSRGGVERRDDCASYGDCLGELLRREEDPPDAQCPRGCAHYQRVPHGWEVERATRVGSDGRSE